MAKAQKKETLLEPKLAELALSITEDMLDPTKANDPKTKIDALKALTVYYATMQKVAPTVEEGSAFGEYQAAISSDGIGRGSGSESGSESELGAALDASADAGNVVELPSNNARGGKPQGREGS